MAPKPVLQYAYHWPGEATDSKHKSCTRWVTRRTWRVSGGHGGSVGRRVLRRAPGRTRLGALGLGGGRVCHLQRDGLDEYVLRLAVDCVELAQVLEDREAVLLAVEAAERVPADLGLV